ncbi:MAG: hypothetical protein JSS28_05925, partial [Proteobacteria bacterium]|nr:hypothetical protein [Pseudomonadota bacterium]
MTTSLDSDTTNSTPALHAAGSTYPAPITQRELDQSLGTAAGLFEPKAGQWPSTLGAGDGGESPSILIDLPQSGSVRFRKIISRSRTVATGKYPSWKTPDRLLHWESPEEAKAFRMLDACPAITKFTEQPFSIRYLHDGEWREHVPDVAFETCFGGRGVLEIKSAVDRNLDAAVLRAKFLAPHFARAGCPYFLVHQESLDAGRSLLNSRELLRFGRSSPSAKAHQQLLAIFGNGKQIAMSNLRHLRIDDIPASHIATQLALRNYLTVT